MGSEAFDRDQLRLAWSAIGAGFAWLLYYAILLPGSVNVPGTDTPFAAATGNTRKLVFEHTDYTTYMGFAYGERPAVMWALTLLPLALAAWWAYRGRGDDWNFLYRSGGDTSRRAPARDYTPAAAGETLVFAGVLGPVVPIVAIEALARLGLWPLGPAASAVVVLAVAVGLAGVAVRHG